MKFNWRRFVPAIKQRPLTSGFAALALISLLAWLALTPRQASLPDFSRFDDVQQMKLAFAAFLSPIVAEQNDTLLATRQELLRMQSRLDRGESLGFFARRRIKALAEQYELAADADLPEWLDALIERIDAVPAALVLAQAAKESGWGRSRFAVEGNNLFGHWCYVKGCGIVPKQRGPGQQHEVARFDSPAQAVERYLFNLNSHESYAALRRLRRQMRDAKQALDPLQLANGLLLYSERREAYVEEVQTMVRQFQRLASAS